MFEYDIEDAICYVETCMDDWHEWNHHTRELDDEDRRDSYDPVESYFFPPQKRPERRERINAYLARDIKY